MKLNDWKREAEQYREIDKAAREEAERAIEEDKKRYQDAITGANPRATAKLIAGLRRSMK